MMRHITLPDLPAPSTSEVGWPWTESSSPLPNAMPDGSTWPRISIVTPSYNQGRFIEETIRSVLLQGYPNLEYIIVDGGSTDESIEVIKKYEPWLSYWVSEKDSGQANAINKGMQKATGEVLAYINSDDLYLPNAFREAAVTMQSNNADLFYGTLKSIPTHELWMPVVSGNLSEWIRGINTTIPQPSSFWRSNPVLPQFDESLNCVFDREFFMQLIRQKAKISTSNKILAIFRVHGGSKTSQLPEQFFRETMIVNHNMIQYLDRAEQDVMLRYLNFQRRRHRFHQATKISLDNICVMLSLIISCPSFLLRRELYGRLSKILLTDNRPKEEAG